MIHLYKITPPRVKAGVESDAGVEPYVYSSSSSVMSMQSGDSEFLDLLDSSLEKSVASNALCDHSRPKNVVLKRVANARPRWPIAWTLW